MHARNLILYVNGILTRPGDAFAWTDRAVRWGNAFFPEGWRADRHEYFSPALLRRLFLRRDAETLARVIADIIADPRSAPRLHLVGHSNGCELIARSIQITGAPIASVHLISGAVSRDFRANGLADRLDRHQVGAVYCYCSRGDRVLQWLAPASRIASLGLAGYGDLGYRGPAGVPAGVDVKTHWEQGLGHGEWFEAEQFERTMRQVLANAQSVRP